MFLNTNSNRISKKPKNKKHADFKLTRVENVIYIYTQ